MIEPLQRSARRGEAWRTVRPSVGESSNEILVELSSATSNFAGETGPEKGTAPGQADRLSRGTWTNETNLPNCVIALANASYETGLWI